MISHFVVCDPEPLCAMARAVAELLASENELFDSPAPPQEVAFLAAALAGRGLRSSKILREAFAVDNEERALEPRA